LQPKLGKHKVTGICHCVVYYARVYAGPMRRGSGRIRKW